MKLHWWIAGAIVIVASGVLVMKHFAESKDRLFHLFDNDDKYNYTEFPADNYVLEFEGTEFLI